MGKMLAYRFRLYPNEDQERKMFYMKDLCRRAYNRLLEEHYNEVTGRCALSKFLTQVKKEWSELNQVYSKCLQPEVDRLFHNISRLKGLEKAGRKVGKLRFKSRVTSKHSPTTSPGSSFSPRMINGAYCTYQKSVIYRYVCTVR